MFGSGVKGGLCKTVEGYSNIGPFGEARAGLGGGRRGRSGLRIGGVGCPAMGVRGCAGDKRREGVKSSQIESNRVKSSQIESN